jgi:hypothetical protein
MHRIIATDDGYQCFACGAFSEQDGALSAVPCSPGGWEHPPYIVGLFADGPMMGDPYIETCAAHPYAGCGQEAYATAYGRRSA